MVTPFASKAQLSVLTPVPQDATTLADSVLTGGIKLE